MVIDLQTHTTASDGTLQPAELVAYARESGVDVLGITDHDTVQGLVEATEAAPLNGIEVVCGIELSCRIEKRSVHMLGLFIDPGSRGLAPTLAKFQSRREHRARGIVDRLNRLGFDISFEEVAAQASGPIGRPHIARVLHQHGYVKSVSDAFSPELIADGGRADVPRKLWTPMEAITAIRSWGGVSVVAHIAGSSSPEISVSLIESLAEAGLSGLEVDHPDHKPNARSELRQIADRLGLAVTGGSDCHGRHSKRPGSETTAVEELDKLRAMVDPPAAR